jgi:rhodanese-related sulfurtransferase
MNLRESKMRKTIVGTVIILLTYAWAHAHTDLTTSQVKALLDAGADVVVVDVREAFEYCDSTAVTPGHIAGSINMPWNSGYFHAHYTELARDDSTIIVCRSGNRSNSAANFLDDQGFTNVFDMLGGMTAWTYETELCDFSGVIPIPEPKTWGRLKALYR